MQRTYIHWILPLGNPQSRASVPSVPRKLFDGNVQLPTPDTAMPSDFMYLFQELRAFRRLRVPQPDSMDNRETVWDNLLAPFDRAMLAATSSGNPFPELLLQIAGDHLKERPCEIGGPNRGPWVRLYMRGHDGGSFPWCAGFVSTVIEQTVAESGPPPIPYCYACNALAGEAQWRGSFRLEPRPGTIKPGWIFLCRNDSGGWGHTGLVERIDGNWLVSIEGNASTTGGTEGTEVCRRIRRIAGKDFIAIGEKSTSIPQYCGRHQR